MRRNAAFTTDLRGALTVALLLVIAGCATTPVPRGVPEATPAPAPEPVPAAVEPAGPERAPAPRVDGAPMVVVLSDTRGRELELLQVFSARLGRPYRIFNLAHRAPDSVSAYLARHAPVDVIALGPSALAATGGIPGVRVVHAAVFAPAAGSAGVDALPPFDVQLDYWRQLNPDLKRLGVIGSARVASRMADLATACRESGMTLEQRTVGSDQEMLLAFRSLVPRIDGFVFLPDESVLSPGVIQQIIAHGRRNNVQTLVYSPVMFNLGATLYVQPDPVSVAQSIITLLAQGGSSVAVREMRVRSRLNGTLALSSVATETPGAREEAGY